MIPSMSFGGGRRMIRSRNDDDAPVDGERGVSQDGAGGRRRDFHVGRRHHRIPAAVLRAELHPMQQSTIVVAPPDGGTTDAALRLGHHHLLLLLLLLPSIPPRRRLRPPSPVRLRQRSREGWAHSCLRCCCGDGENRRRGGRGDRRSAPPRRVSPHDASSMLEKGKCNKNGTENIGIQAFDAILQLTVWAIG